MKYLLAIAACSVLRIMNLFPDGNLKDSADMICTLMEVNLRSFNLQVKFYLEKVQKLSRKRYYLDCVCKSRGRVSQDSSLAVDLLSYVYFRRLK